MRRMRVMRGESWELLVHPRILVFLMILMVKSSFARQAGPEEERLLKLIAEQPAVAANYVDLARLYYKMRRLSDAEAMLVRGIDAVKHDRQSPPPPPAAVPGQPQPVGGDVPEPFRTKDAAPGYPADAQRAGVSGFVTLEFVVDREGKVRDVRVLKSVPMLDRAAVDAAKRWRYKPTIVGGQAVEVLAAAAINFTFRSEPQTLDQIESGRFYADRRYYADAERSLGLALKLIREERSWFGARPEVGPVNAADPTRAGLSRQDIVPPSKVKTRPPVYPAFAIQNRISGDVVIEAVIDAQGRIAATRVLRSVPVLEQAAVDAVRKWEYTPTLVKGVPTAVLMTVVVTFRLQ